MKDINYLKFLYQFEKEINSYINKLKRYHNILTSPITTYYEFVNRPSFTVEWISIKTGSSKEYEFKNYHKLTKHVEYYKNNKYYVLVPHVTKAVGKMHYCLGMYDKLMFRHYITATSYFPKSGPTIEFREYDKETFEYYLNLDPLNENKRIYTKEQIDTLNDYYFN